MENITLNQLSSIKNCTSNDILLISRKNDNNIYVSYTYNLKDMHKHISDDVNWSLIDAYQRHVNKLNTDFNNLSTNLSDIISAHIVECSNLHEQLRNDLKSEINLLSTDLTAKMSQHEKDVALSIDRITSEFNKLSNDLTKQYAKHEIYVNDQLKTLSTEIKAWITNNFVSLAGDQEITGKKKFTQEIDGTAKQAKWA